MGCDIHLYAEAKTPKGWQLLTPPKGTGYVSGGPRDQTPKAPYRIEYDPGEEPPKAETWFSDCNYDLFSMLADVRNEPGGPVPIFPCRGMPKDVSREIANMCEGWGVDGHSHTHFTVAELRAYFERMKDRTYTDHGVVDGKAFEHLQSTGERPTSWSKSISGIGFGIVTVTERMYRSIQHLVKHDKTANRWRENQTVLRAVDAPSHFRGILRDLKPVPDAQGLYSIYVQTMWARRYECPSFLALLDELSAYGPEDSIRVVCWFDN